MAGTLFGLPLSQQVDETGAPLSGGLLYIYSANTSTPANSYSDFALSTVRTNPIQLDAVGRIPAFYVADGSYRARLTTSAGVEIFDEQSITSIGASSASSGGSVSQDTTTIFQTGDMLWLPIAGTRSGWVRCNGRTIGSSASGGAERANTDAQALFEYFWNNFSNAICAVSSGRGATATADFNANKTIATLDMRSKGALGLDGMGNSAASVTGGSDTAATAIGASTYTVAQSNLPNINLSSSALVVTMTTGTFLRGTLDNVTNDSGGADLVTSGSVTTLGAVVTGTVPLGGSGTQLEILAPVRVGSWYAKL